MVTFLHLKFSCQVLLQVCPQSCKFLKKVLFFSLRICFRLDRLNRTEKQEFTDQYNKLYPKVEYEVTDETDSDFLKMANEQIL